MNALILWLAQGFGLGRIPFAPGTWGSAAVLPLVWALHQGWGWAAVLALAVALTVSGVPLCEAAAKSLGKRDPGSVVWDEFAGMAWAGVLAPDLPSLLAAFVLFRLFDILKPGLRRVEALPGGWGIMMDDVVAGIAATAILGIVLFFTGGSV